MGGGTALKYTQWNTPAGIFNRTNIGPTDIQNMVGPITCLLTRACQLFSLYAPYLMPGPSAGLSARGKGSGKGHGANA